MSNDKLLTRASVLLSMFNTHEENAEISMYDEEDQTLNHRTEALMSPQKHHKED